MAKGLDARVTALERDRPEQTESIRVVHVDEDGQGWQWDTATQCHVKADLPEPGRGDCVRIIGGVDLRRL